MGKTFFVITVDTECDRSTSWRASNPLTFRSVLEGIPERLQPLLRAFDAKPTYLISAEVLENARCVETLASLAGDYELGTHLHGAYVEPQKMYENYAGTETPELTCFYDEALEAAKIETLTKLFEDRFGFAPTSYRAGRFGAGANTIRVLEGLGYKVDTSVTPHVCWEDPAGRVDFTDAPEQPYFPDLHDLTRRGNSTVLEVPVSIVRHPWRSEVVNKVIQRARMGFVTRLSDRFLGPIWLRPSFSTAEQMTRLIEDYLERYRKNACVVLNMMFHSMEIVPNASPYARMERDCQRLLLRIRKVLGFCANTGTEFVTLSQLPHRLAEPQMAPRDAG